MAELPIADASCKENAVRESDSFRSGKGATEARLFLEDVCRTRIKHIAPGIIKMPHHQELRRKP